MQKPSLIRYAGTHMKSPRYAVDLCVIFRAAVERGWQTCIVLSNPPDDDAWLKPFRELGVHVAYLPRPKRNFDFGCMRRAAQLCRERSCTVFHCDNMHTSPMLGAWMAGVPVRVWSKRSMQPVYEECREPNWRDRFAPSVRMTFNLATRVLPVSSAVGNELVSLGMAAHKITVFRNACDRPTAPVDRTAVRARLGLNTDDIAVITVGRAARVKGWDLLVSAFVSVAASVANAKLVLVGGFEGREERPAYESLKREIVAAGLDQRVTFTGYSRNVFEMLAAADVFVMPSRSEGDSNALLQALMSGLPCIATRVGSAADLIESGTNGILVPRADVPAMADALRSVLSNAQLRKSLAVAAAAKEHAPTSLEYATRLVDLYESLLTGRDQQHEIQPDIHTAAESKA